MTGILQVVRRYLRVPVAKADREVGDAVHLEIAFHVSERARDLMDQGMPPEKAYEAALDRFGDISRVTDECRAESLLSLIVLHRFHLVMTAALACAVVCLGLLFLGSARHSQSIRGIPPGIASMLDNDWTGGVSGQVVDDLGQPISGANVLVVVKTWPDQSYFQRAYATVTNSQGGFNLENVHPENERYAVQIAVVTANRTIQSSYKSVAKGAWDPVTLRLPPSSGFTLRVENSKGVPIANAQIIPQQRIDSQGNTHFVYFDSAQSIIHRTDARGTVELPYFQAGDSVTVLLLNASGEWEPCSVYAPASGHTASIRVESNEVNLSKET